ncbi:MAG TPA: hypothetical protein VN038_14685, partial [Dyadobacter sp.]|nr:hypothetical protein [Dyadobacter sp.]
MTYFLAINQKADMTGDIKRPSLNRLIFTVFGILSLSFSVPALAGVDADTLYRRNPGTVTKQ